MENIEQNERDLLERSRQVATLGEYFEWLQRYEEFIEELEELSRVKRPRLSIGNRQSLVTRIARLESAKTRLQRQFIPSGGDYSGDYSDNNAERLIWREIDTAFESRILTGAIINSNYIEPCRFLEDAKNIVLEHVQKVIQRHTSVKVNTAFNGEFVSDDKHANKSVNTRNYCCKKNCISYFSVRFKYILCIHFMLNIEHALFTSFSFVFRSEQRFRSFSFFLTLAFL